MSIILVQPLNTGVSAMVPFGSSSLPATPLFITTDDTIATVTTEGYLSEASKQFVIPVANKQGAWVYTTDGGMQLYQVSVSGAVVSLIPTAGSTTGILVDGHLPEFEGTTGTVKDSGIPANRVLVTSFNTPDTNINLVSFDVAVPAASLAAGASVTLFASSGTKQYRVRSLWINAGGTNFSGGGGDRNLSITDNTTVYSVVPAATLGTLVNAGWGDGTDLPYPASAAINQASAAGQAIVAKYSGGAADFSAGSVTISGVLQRIA